MKLVDEGLTSTSKLLHYLEDFFEFDSHYERQDTSLSDQIAYISNHKGWWTIGFTGIPDSDLMLAIVAIFARKINWDGLEEVIFNYETAHQQIFTRIGGTAYSYEGLSKVMKVIHEADNAVMESLRKSKS